MKKIMFILSIIISITCLPFLYVHADTINIPADYLTIQQGINAASDGDIVLVQPGMYYENIDYNGKNITVASLLYTSQDTSYISQTIINGSSLNSVITFQNNEDASAVLCGFTVTNGYSGYGGGIYCSSSSPTIEHVVIKNNTVTFQGGGLYCYSNASPTLQYVVIKNNSTTIFGGGIFCNSSSLILQHVEISQNSSNGHGAGIYCSDSSCPELNNVTITRNIASNMGSGIYCSGNSSPIATNSIIAENYGTYGCYVSSGNPVITHTDCWNNEGGNFYQCSAGTGCIDADPLFLDPTNGNYHLSWTNFPTPDATKSPCIDSGDPASPLDPDDTRTDMGAYYFDQIITGVEPQETPGLLFTLYPNPVYSHTPNLVVQYSLSKPCHISISLYNVKGQCIERIVDENKDSGEYSIDFSGDRLSSGIYFTRLRIDGIDTKIKKLIILN